MSAKKAALALEDGSFFLGRSFGAEGERSGELVFNTSMTGYQEVLTDPSYKGQLVVMTYPLIGNYGITEADMESRRPFLEAFIVREACRTPSNWQSAMSLAAFLEREGVVGLEGVDTRALALLLRGKGALRAVVSTEDLDPRSLGAKARAVRSMVGADLAREVSTDRAYPWPAPGESSLYHAVVVDYGVKHGILRSLAETGARITVVPAAASAAEILALAPDGVMLSNGPGDPEPLGYAVDAIRRLLDAGLPVYGICLGHQLLARAFGAKTYKLKFGHRGANHPVQETAGGRVRVTTHNHGFAVDEGSLPRGLRATYRSLNDGTLEGFEHEQFSAAAVQFHPEACAGPHDAKDFFLRFKAAVLASKVARGGRLA